MRVRFLFFAVTLMLLAALSGCQSVGSTLGRTQHTGASDMLRMGEALGSLFEGGGLSSNSQSWPSGLPENYQEFKQRYSSYGTTPEGAVRMYFDALYSYTSGNKAEGLKMLRYALHAQKGWERGSYYSTFIERLKNPAWHYIFRSFAKGSSPANDYAMSPHNYELMFKYTRNMGSYTQVALISSGADSPRIMQVQRFDDGLWYVTQNAASYSDVRQPATARSRHTHDADFD